jgi:hypothetical protein
MTGNSHSLRVAFVLAITVGLLAVAMTHTKPSIGGSASPSPVASPYGGSPIASPVADTACPGADTYLAAIGPILAPLLHADDPVALTADWTYVESGTYSGDEWRAVSERYGAALAAWTAIDPPAWADAWHSATETELSLRANASLAASTRGVYAMGVYAGAIRAARETSASDLNDLARACPGVASALHELLQDDA